MGLDLVEWTYDPMQAMNAHFNFAKLGVVVEEYEENIYGESSSLLHKGNPTDRFVAEWWIREDRVAQRLAGATPLASALTIEPANRTTPAGEWLEPAAIDLTLDARRVAVEIPIGLHRDAVEGAGPGARVADGDARAVHRLSRPRLPRRRVLPRPPQPPRVVPADEEA